MWDGRVGQERFWDVPPGLLSEGDLRGEGQSSRGIVAQMGQVTALGLGCEDQGGEDPGKADGVHVWWQRVGLHIRSGWKSRAGFSLF